MTVIISRDTQTSHQITTFDLLGAVHDLADTHQANKAWALQHRSRTGSITAPSAAQQKLLDLLCGWRSTPGVMVDQHPHDVPAVPRAAGPLTAEEHKMLSRIEQGIADNLIFALNPGDVHRVAALATNLADDRLAPADQQERVQRSWQIVDHDLRHRILRQQIQLASQPDLIDLSPTGFWPALTEALSDTLMLSDHSIGRDDATAEARVLVSTLKEERRDHRRQVRAEYKNALDALTNNGVGPHPASTVKTVEERYR